MNGNKLDSEDKSIVEQTRKSGCFWEFWANGVEYDSVTECVWLAWPGPRLGSLNGRS